MSGDLTTLLIVMATFFIANLILGITSFGCQLILLPILSLLFPLQILVPLLTVYVMPINIILFLFIYKNLQLKNMSYLALAGIIGTPLGTYLLLVVNDGILKIGVGISIIISVWAIYTSSSVYFKNEKLGNIVAGFLSGLLNGSLSMAGPPVILFYSNNHLEKQAFRANLIFYFLILNIITCPVMYFSGLLTPQVVHYMVSLSPALVVGAIGVLVGNKLANRLNNVVFNQVTLILVGIMGVLSIFSGL